MLPRATMTRSPRSAASSNKRSVEISRFLGRCLRAVVDLSVLGPWLIQIDCDVVDADGGTRCAALTGSFTAMQDAVRALARRENRADPLREAVVGISVASVDGRLVVDPSYDEDHRASIDLTVALTASRRIVEIHAASEAEPYARETLDQMLDLASEAAETPFAAQRGCGETGGSDDSGHRHGQR